MMSSHRKERVANQVRKIISEALVHRMGDPRITPLTTVTRVEMTGDLESAKVFLVIRGGDVVERRTLQAIRHATGFLQRIVARELVIRQCPVIRFEIDKAAKIAHETMSRLAENRRKQPYLFEDSGVESPKPNGCGPSGGQDSERSGPGSSDAANPNGADSRREFNE